MERHFRDALEEDEVVYDHSQFGLLNNSSADDSYKPLTEQASPSARKVPPDRARCGKLLRTAALCGAYISLGMCMAVTGPTLPFLKDQVGSTVAEISWIFTARSAGTLGGSFMGGLVLDRFNPYSIFFLTVAAMALGTGAMPWCKHLWMLMAASIMVGIANGFLDTGASTVCLRLWGKESGPYMQAMHFAFAVGGSLAPLLVQAFIGETTALLQHSNMTTLPFSTGTPATSIRHVRAAIANQDTDDAFGNTTVKAILEAVIQNPVVQGNTTSASTNRTTSLEKSGTVVESSDKLDGNLNITTLLENATTTTEKPPRPKPAKIDGAAIGPSEKFDNSPLKLEPAAPVATTITSTTDIGNTTITTPSTTLLSSNFTAVVNLTLLNAEAMQTPSLNLNETAPTSPTMNASSPVGNETQSLPVVNTNQTESTGTSLTVLTTTTTTTAPSTTTSTTTIAPTTSTTTPAPTTSTTTPAPTTTSTTTTSTASTTIALIPTFPVATADAVNVTKSRGKSRGQQLEEEVTTTTTVSPEIIHSGTSPSGGRTYANYLELFGVTRMHLLYTVIAIIVLHTAFSFLFFLCSSSDNRASSIAASAESRKLSGEQSNFRPRPKLIFVGLLFSFYLLYVGAEVVFAQFLTTFALESHLHVSTSAANYVTTTFWAAFAAARFGAIFFAHFMSPTVMLLLNLGLTTIGSLILCIAAQTSIYVLYIGSALIGVGMASTFATGFVWTEKHLLVTNRISASFSIASAMGEMIFPTMTGALMETSSMSLMYVVLVANLLCVTTFLAARMLAKSQGGSRSGRGYQLAAQQADEEESYLAHH